MAIFLYFSGARIVRIHDHDLVQGATIDIDAELVTEITIVLAFSTTTIVVIFPSSIYRTNHSYLFVYFHIGNRFNNRGFQNRDFRNNRRWNNNRNNGWNNNRNNNNRYGRNWRSRSRSFSRSRSPYERHDSEHNNSIPPVKPPSPPDNAMIDAQPNTN